MIEWMAPGNARMQEGWRKRIYARAYIHSITTLIHSHIYDNYDNKQIFLIIVNIRYGVTVTIWRSYPALQQIWKWSNGQQERKIIFIKIYLNNGQKYYQNRF